MRGIEKKVRKVETKKREFIEEAKEKMDYAVENEKISGLYRKEHEHLKEVKRVRDSTEPTQVKYGPKNNKTYGVGVKQPVSRGYARQYSRKSQTRVQEGFVQEQKIVPRAEVREAAPVLGSLTELRERHLDQIGAIIKKRAGTETIRRKQLKKSMIGK